MTAEPLFPPLGQRYQGPEDMDLPDVDPALLANTFRLFALSNPLLTASRHLIRRHIFTSMERRGMKHATVVDIGAGGCDIAVWMVREAKRRGLSLSVAALDRDPRALAVAQAAVRKIPEISLIQADWSAIASMGRFDFAFSNHVLHHFDEKDIVSLLRLLTGTITHGFVLNDLRRAWWAYAGYYAVSRLLFRRSLAHRDGLLSIRKGFTYAEWTQLCARELPDAGIRVERAFPARLALVWQRSR